MMARANGRTWLAAVLGAGASAAALASLAFGCAGSEKSSGVAESTLPEGTHIETLDHEACNESGHRVEALDSNNDGKPDIKQVYDLKTGKEVCRITDLDHDGKPDMFEYYDANGSLRRREAGFDMSGVVDSIEFYDNGKLAKRELDTTGQHRVDTWDFFDGSGKLARRERDSTNDGKVDQWWTYEGDKVTIAMDRNGDGKPDPENTVTIGGGDEASPKANANAVADAAPPPKPAVYVPAGMDAGDLALSPIPAASPVDAGSDGGKTSTANKKGKK